MEAEKKFYKRNGSVPLQVTTRVDSTFDAKVIMELTAEDDNYGCLFAWLNPSEAISLGLALVEEGRRVALEQAQ